MRGFIWRLVGWVCARPAVAAWLIRRAQRNPYSHIGDYMGRFWLFNPYDRVPGMVRIPFLPWAFRVHHICRPDGDRHLHNHPWNARSIILRGGYREQREASPEVAAEFADWVAAFGSEAISEYYDRRPGDSFTIGADDYHAIRELFEGEAWTLFITSRWRHVWGFKVENRHIEHRDYLNYN